MLGVNAAPGPPVPSDQKARRGPGWGLAPRPACSASPTPWWFMQAGVSGPPARLTFGGQCGGTLVTAVASTVLFSNGFLCREGQPESAP